MGHVQLPGRLHSEGWGQYEYCLVQYQLYVENQLLQVFNELLES